MQPPMHPNMRALPILPPPPPPPPLPPPSQSSARPALSRSRMPPTLMRTTQWQYTGGLDAIAYPSPPMTGSPTSPKRHQFLDERQQQQQPYSYQQRPGYPQASPQQQLHDPVGHHPEGYPHSASSVSGGQYRPGQSYMAAQVLPSPTAPGPHSAGFVVPPPYSPVTPGYAEDAAHAHVRQRAQSIPTYTGGFQVGQYSDPGMMNMSYGQGPYAHPAMMHAPPGLVHAPGRIPPRTGSRRPKPHVTRACVNCKKAHLSCDNQRPCGRCVSTRKEPTCVDVEHKKRGRPRIQPERGHAAERSHASASRGPPPITPPSHLQATADALGLLRTHPTVNIDRRGSLPALSTTPQAYPSVDPRLGGSQSASYDTSSFRLSDTMSAPRWRTDDVALIAFTNLDLRIVKVNSPLQALFAEKGDLRGVDVDELLDSKHHAALRQLQAELREERNRREPHKLPGISPDQEEQRLVHDLSEQDIPRITHGFDLDKSDTWTLKLSQGRLENFYCRVRLARHSFFLVAIELRRLLPEATYSSLSYSGGAPPGGPEYSSGRATGPPTSLSSHQRSAPLVTSPLREHMYSSSSSYFPRQPGVVSPPTGPTANPSSHSMQPPPAPASAGLPPLHRSHTAREVRRPEPLSNVQLPPIINSAPTTPLTPGFGESPFSFTPQQAQPAPQSQTSPQFPPQPSSSTTRRSSASEDADDDRPSKRFKIRDVLE